jgi:hypothetical protein
MKWMDDDGDDDGPIMDDSANKINNYVNIASVMNSAGRTSTNH